jgi:hypothetical protein
MRRYHMNDERIAAAIAELKSTPHVSVETAGIAMGAGRNLAYEMARRGDLPVIHIGRKKLRVLSRPLLERLQVDD